MCDGPAAFEFDISIISQDPLADLVTQELVVLTHFGSSVVIPRAFLKISEAFSKIPEPFSKSVILCE